MILECIVTSLDEQARLNIAPMGPLVADGDLQLERFVLRPYQTSQTFANLREQRAGVLHVTDDVQLLAQAAIADWPSLPRTQPATQIAGCVLSNVCRWYEFEVVSVDESDVRTTLDCRTVHRGRNRDFLGFNRAKHAVVEAAILMTRLEWLPSTEIQRHMETLSGIVDKTAGQREQSAFALLADHFQAHCRKTTVADDG